VATTFGVAQAVTSNDRTIRIKSFVGVDMTIFPQSGPL
jgi:hypothetical protein